MQAFRALPALLMLRISCFCRQDNATRKITTLVIVEPTPTQVQLRMQVITLPDFLQLWKVIIRLLNGARMRKASIIVVKGSCARQRIFTAVLHSAVGQGSCESEAVSGEGTLGDSRNAKVKDKK